jgi:putative hydrolase of the HAD superfamily
MGLDGVIDQVFTSALTGYEKPNPEAFRIALGGADPEACFMVGDNPVADVLGAEQVGIRGILVRGEASSGRPSAPDLMAAAAVILDTP